MHSALQPSLRAAIGFLLSVLAIAVVLAAGAFLVDGVKGAVSSRERLTALESVANQVERYRRQEGDSLVQRMASARQLPLTAIDARILGVTRELAEHTQAGPGDLAILLQAGPEAYAGQLAARYQARLTHALLQQELHHLRQLRAYLFAGQHRQAAEAELARLKQQHRALYARAMQKQAAIARLGWIDRQRLQRPWARDAKLEQLLAEATALAARNNQTAAAYRAQKLAIERMQKLGEVAAFALEARQLDGALQPLAQDLADARDALARHWLSRVAAPVLDLLPLAVGIVLAAIAGKIAIRVFFYFVLAPLATRGAAVRLAREPKRGRQPRARHAGEPVMLLAPSAVSHTLQLGDDEELLVLPSYLQSAPVGAARSTRWLITGRAWASLSSGMSLLTCVRTRDRGEQLVLSASDDGLSEIALLRIPDGQGLVIQPRALVGVLAQRDRPLDIRWHWRPGSLHAWLTLQLRYFVLRGPVTVVVQGRRGVRLQSACAAQAIRQDATLGFSTGVAYATVRSEPFLPYLRGQAPLLYDRFDGDGVYLYDETPGASRPGRLSRGLEGMTDALLKLVGY